MVLSAGKAHIIKNETRLQWKPFFPSLTVNLHPALQLWFLCQQGRAWLTIWWFLENSQEPSKNHGKKRSTQSVDGKQKTIPCKTETGKMLNVCMRGGNEDRKPVSILRSAMLNIIHTNRSSLWLWRVHKHKCKGLSHSTKIKRWEKKLYLRKADQ